MTVREAKKILENLSKLKNSVKNSQSYTPQTIEMARMILWEELSKSMSHH